MIVIESRAAIHLLATGINAEGFKVRRGRNEFEALPHWVRPRLQNFIDSGLMTYEEVLPPAPKKADTDPAPPVTDEPGAGDATEPAPGAEARRKRR